MGNIHFQARLNPNNPAEAQAIEVLRVLENKGYDRREILTEALLLLADRNLDDFKPPRDRVVENAVEQAMGGMLDRFVMAIEARLDDLRALAPDVRRREMRDVARNSFGDSIMSAVDVEEWRGDE